MARRTKKNSDGERLVGWVLALALCGFLMQCPQILLIAALLGVPVAYVYLSSRSRQWHRLRALRLADVDNMSGHDFEHYVAALLDHRGFETEVTKGSGDFGVDVVARKGKLKYAVQTKRYSNAVERKAVSDAVAAKSHYRCNAAMVVTSNRFTQGAVEFAASVGGELVN